MFCSAYLESFTFTVSSLESNKALLMAASAGDEDDDDDLYGVADLLGDDESPLEKHR